MSLKARFLNSDFHRVFNMQGEVNKGRTLTFVNTAMANIANAVITGALYTAFLAENGIDIVRVGIISFIPYISWMLSIFSPTILSHFRFRQKLLLLNDWIYYGTIVLGTTIMPLFVKDPTARTIWFAVLIFIGNVSNALVGSGYTAWLIRFVPKGRDLNVYISWSNMVNLICSNLTAIAASFAATWIAARGNQFWFLFTLRIISFVVFMTGTSMIYLIPKEEPVPESPIKIRPLHVLTEPLKHKPFMLTALITVLWGMTVNLNGSTHAYFMLETVKLPMIYLYMGSVATMITSLTLSKRYRRFMDRTSAYSVIAFFAMVHAALEVFYIFVGPGRAALYVVLSIFSGIADVGFVMGYNALFYLHIPKDANNDLSATFWNLAGNISAFVGAAAGTWLLSRFEAHGIYDIFGMDFYGSQLLCCVKLVCFIITIAYVRRVTPVLNTEKAA